MAVVKCKDILSKYQVIVIICDNNNYVGTYLNKQDRVETALYCADANYKLYEGFTEGFSTGTAVVKVYGYKQAQLRAKLERILSYI